jgi:hypothetical protein
MTVQNSPIYIYFLHSRSHSDTVSEECYRAVWLSEVQVGVDGERCHVDLRILGIIVKDKALTQRRRLQKWM